MNLTLAEIAKFTECELSGDANAKATGICGLDAPQEGAVSYISSLDKINLPENLNIAALIVPAAAKEKELPFKGNVLYSQNPEWSFNLLMRAVDTTNKHITAGIHPKAYVAPTAKTGNNVFVGANATIEDGAVIGDNTIIYPNVYIGRNVKVGKDCVIYPNVTVREECEIKNRVILQPGAVIGSDGFGYILHNSKHEKIPQIGNVIINDDVEIGANTTIDRAKINHTVIGVNTKIDNLVQIGHNVKIGVSSVIVSQVGIAGSTEVGNGVVIAGQVGVSGHIKIGDGAMLGPQAGIMSSIEPGAKVMGSPARPYGEFMRITAIMGKLPEVYKEFLAFKKKLKFF